VDELRSAGADVRVLQGDVASRQDVARILEEIDRTMAPLRGIVHAAGINDVGFIERQPWASFEAVFPSKVRGAWNLHTLTGTRSLDFFLLFSSTAAVFGGLGQANYSGANAFLDSLAHYRRSCGLPALAIDWGPWAEVGMAARLGEQVRRRWAAQGVRMMSPAHAIATLAYLMRVETPQAIATSIDWPTFVRGYPQIERVSLFAAMRAENPAGIEALDSSASIDLRRRLAEAGADEARELVQDYVRYQFAEALGFEPSHPLDPELNFLEMGVDSLVATRVMLVLNETLRVNLAVSVMFEHPTIATLAAEVNRVRIIAAPSAGDCAAHDSSHVETVEAPPWLSAPVIGEDQTADARAAEETSMVHDDDVNAAPLSSAQQRIWFVNKFETYEPAYNEPLILRMTGNLQVPVMVAALEEIARRHEILRTIFRHDKDGPVQVVLPPAPLDMTVDDLLAIPETEREGHLWQALSDEVRRPFDLSLGPLWRARLFRVRENEHVLALVLHHIITDGWSHGVLAREAMTLYMAYSTGPHPSAAAALGTPGRPSPLPTLPIQYRHYARRQRQQLEGERVQSQLQYWERQLAGLPVLEWPFLPARRARQTFRGALHSFLIPRATAEQLTALSQRERTTLFMTLLAAFFVLLYRHTRQSDFAVGTPVAGRTATDTKPLLGLFLNLLVLRAKVDGSITFRELLARVRQTSLEAFDHQDVPFDHLIDEMGIRRDLSRSPLFQVMFVLQNTPLPKLSVGGLEVEQLKVDRGTSKLDFTLSIEPTSRGLEGFIEYSTDIFDASLMAAMMRHYQQILEGIIAQPDQRVAELPLLTANERDQIVTTWNASAQVWPDPTANSLVAWLESQAARTPNAIAVWTDASPENRAPIPEPEMWTYATLHARANQIARRLQRLGVGAESRVGVWLPRSPQMVAALIGVLKAGGAYLPLDPSYPAARLAFQVADAQVAVVLTSTECAADVPPGAYAIEVVDAPDAAWRQEAQTAPAVRVSPDQLAYVIYTSGSTGQPKGAMNSHRGIGNRLAWMQATYGLTAADRVLQKTSINFDVSVWELFLPLGTGATLVVAKPGGQNDPAYLADIIQRAGVTVLHFVPAMLEAFVTAGGLTSCARVRLMVCSGEALPGPLAARCLTAWPGQLENLYGPTEAAVDVTWQPCTPKVTSAAIVPIGRPVANTQVYVRDAVGQPVPAGVVGELYLGGVQVGRGYWARPDLTAERFVPDPFSTIPGARLYRTGDLARYRSDGVVEYVGRIDQQVKLRGNRIELGEIEAVLRQQPGIRDAAVVLREDESGARRLVGYVVPAGPAAEVVIETLRQQLRAQLPEYMVPAAIVALDALPLNPNGKVDRRALPEPGPMRPALKVEFVAPRNELERLLADIEAEVLGLDRVGIHDNFFDLGGASLSGLDIMSRLNEAGIAVEPMQLFEYQTVAELAAALIESGAAVGDASPQALDIGLGIQVPSPEPQAPSVI
ncbi:MAG TPA: amino acid adenylation domain-containing protein, partial [Vicinamibacterales bacterium]|nr:amino acid adenylation domain-containing protein [Vicinamibacterales bacterium]